MKVLLVDDEANLLRSLQRYLSREGWDIATASNGLSAQKQLLEHPFDLLVLDLKMPGMDGLELLRWLSTEGPDLPAIMISAYGEVEDAVAAMREGASDYLVKPFDPEELLLKGNRVVQERLDHRIARIERSEERGFHSRNPAMEELYGLVERAAGSDSTILITGESGTGKEVLAREVHSRSHRREGPFVAVNVSALPEQLLESELFGYERGAFTGAESRKLGYLESASGGTLFLDEIGEMPMSLQAKLLRVLQERTINRVGGTASLPVDFRLLAATNVDLEEAVRERRFREDLYFRLNVIRLALPPLRERPEDIPELAAHFLEKLTARTGYPTRELSEASLRALEAYDFPGNIRELENCMERALILAKGAVIAPEDLGLTGVTPTRRAVEGDRDLSGGALTLREIEAQAIERALLRNEGHRQKSAEELGISRRTLLNKIKEYGLDSE